MAELIEMPFGMKTPVGGPRYNVLDGGTVPPQDRHFGGGVGAVGKHCKSAAQ